MAGFTLIEKLKDCQCKENKNTKYTALENIMWT